MRLRARSAAAFASQERRKHGAVTTADDRRGQGPLRRGKRAGCGTASPRDVIDVVSRRPSALRGAAPGGRGGLRVGLGRGGDAARRRGKCLGEARGTWQSPWAHVTTHGRGEVIETKKTVVQPLDGWRGGGGGGGGGKKDDLGPIGCALGSDGAVVSGVQVFHLPLLGLPCSHAPARQVGGGGLVPWEAEKTAARPWPMTGAAKCPPEGTRNVLFAPVRHLCASNGAIDYSAASILYLRAGQRGVKHGGRFLEMRISRRDATHPLSA